MKKTLKTFLWTISSFVFVLAINQGAFGGDDGDWTRTGDVLSPANPTTDRVGIGTTTPRKGSALHVKGSTNTVAIMETTDSSNTAWLFLKNPGVSGDFNTVGIASQNDHLHLRAGDATRVFVRGDGHVGIGTTNPRGGSTLHVKGADNSNNPALFESTHSSNTAWLFLKNPGVSGDFNTVGIGSQNDHLHLRAGDATRIFIRGDGHVGIGTATPRANLDVVGTTRTST